MKIVLKAGVALFAATLVSCGGSKLDKYPMEKPYWGKEDYDNVIRQIEYQTPEGEKYPLLSDPETAPIFNKLINRENVSVVVEDNTLGLNHRADFASDMFDEYRDLANLYSPMDREDKYIYSHEFAEVLRFGLYLQIHYFKLGNDAMVKEADNAEQVKTTVHNNEQTLISNFIIYLDYINKESAFSNEALESIAAGMDDSFFEMIKVFPNGNYKGMISKAENMEKKATHPALKKSLTKLLEKLRSISPPEEPTTP